MTCDAQFLSAVREAIEAAGFTVDSAELTMVPKTTVEVADEADAKKVLRLMDELEDNDDVQDVYANFDIPERVLEAVAGCRSPVAARGRQGRPTRAYVSP